MRKGVLIKQPQRVFFHNFDVRRFHSNSYHQSLSSYAVLSTLQKVYGGVPHNEEFQRVECSFLSSGPRYIDGNSFRTNNAHTVS